MRPITSKTDNASNRPDEDGAAREDSSPHPTSDTSLVLIVAADGKIVEVHDTSALGDEPVPRELRGRSVTDIWPEEMSVPIRDEIKRVLRSRQVRSTTLRHPTLNRHYEVVFIAQGRDRVMLVMRDVSRTQREISRLEQLAYGDDLTGLPNREWFLAEIDRVIEQLRLRGGRAAVICLDIRQSETTGNVPSRLKRDAILKELAARLAHGLRGTNRPNVGDEDRNSWVARVDVRRFAVILPSIRSGEDAAAVATRLVDSLEQPVVIGKTERRVEVMAGIALYPQDGARSIELYESAVTAAEDAHNSLSSRQKFHSGTVRMRALQRDDLELELKSALANREFALTYLPIVERVTRRPVAAEALLRWPTRLSGATRISEVIAAADFTGLMAPIGEWVCESACRQLAEWRGRGFESLRITVNVSAQEFALANIVERTQRILEQTQLDPRSLTIEITEHLVFRDAMREFAVCTGLKALGVGIAIDDYGTGICSFEHLAKSPVDTIKIHQNFVSEAASSDTCRAACAAIIAMAHELGLTVVAEGIETEEQAETLESAGCDYLQGFLIGKPFSADDFATYFATYSATQSNPDAAQ